MTAKALRLPPAARFPRIRCALLLCSLLTAAPLKAEPLSIAVAANFQSTYLELARDFRARTGTELRHSAGASGILYAQIRAGAAFDILLSADQERPRLLEESGHGIAGSRFTYAIGQLALWVPGNERTALLGAAALSGGHIRLAMANPTAAPYGTAAEQLLRDIERSAVIDYQPILGNNVGQAFQFAISGNVSAALIAYSHILDWRSLHPGEIPPGEIWLVPAERHEPILQQAILVRKNTPHPAAVPFMQYLQSAEGRGIMADHGYRLLPQS